MAWCLRSTKELFYSKETLVWTRKPDTGEVATKTLYISCVGQWSSGAPFILQEGTSTVAPRSTVPLMNGHEFITGVESNLSSRKTAVSKVTE